MHPDTIAEIMTKVGNHVATNFISPATHGSFIQLERKEDTYICTRFEGEYLLNYGYTREFCLGKEWREINPLKENILLQYFERVMKGETIAFENRKYFDDGMEYLLIFEPVVDQEIAVQINLYFLDISSWNENIMINILSNDGTILYVSPKWCDVSGYTTESVLGKSIYPYMEPESLLLSQTVTEKIIRTQQAHPFAFKGINADGRICNYFSVVIPIIHDHTNRGIIVFTLNTSFSS